MSPEKSIEKEKQNLFKGIIAATGIFGFGYYSMGFLVLTVAIVSNNLVLGALTYTIFLASSSIIGFIMSRVKINREVLSLGILGYGIAGIGALLYAISLFLMYPYWTFYVFTALIGIGSGFTEVLEPTLISKISRSVGKGMGWLSASRSAGLFFANLIMGFLYFIQPGYSYIYAFSVSLLAALLVITTGRSFDQKIDKTAL